MSSPSDAAVHEMGDELRRLIDALDRRVPRLERAGESHIAGEAAELRARAVALLATLDRARPA